MMKELTKHFLDFEKTIDYFKDHIEMDNILSKYTLKSISFDKGYFYTLLTSDSDLSKLYQFEVGHILPPIPSKKVYDPRTQFVSEFEWINSIRDEFAEYLLKTLKQSSNKICIFDDGLREIDEIGISELVKEKVATSIEEEIYYVLTNETELKYIKQAIKNSQVFWHCLGIVSSFQIKTSQLQRLDLEQICKNIEMIITEAYDGEGFLVWRKK